MNERRRQKGLVAAAGLSRSVSPAGGPTSPTSWEHHAIVYPPPSELGYRQGDASQVPANLDGRGQAATETCRLGVPRTDSNGGPMEWKAPGVFDRHEYAMASDTRNGGFGPFFGAATVLSFGALGWALVNGRGEGRRLSSAGVVRLDRLRRSDDDALSGAVVGAIRPAGLACDGFGRGLAWNCGRARLCGLARSAWLASPCSTAPSRDGAPQSTGSQSARDIEDKLNRMAQDPNPVYLTRGTVWNAAIKGRHAAEDVWRRRLSDRGQADVVIIPRA